MRRSNFNWEEHTEQNAKYIDLSYKISQLKWWIQGELDVYSCPTQQVLELNQKRVNARIYDLFLSEWENMVACMDKELLTHMLTVFTTRETTFLYSWSDHYHQGLYDLGPAPRDLTFGDFEDRAKGIATRLDTLDQRFADEDATIETIEPELKHINEQLNKILPCVELVEMLSNLRAKLHGVQCQLDWLKHTQEKACQKN